MYGAERQLALGPTLHIRTRHGHIFSLKSPYFTPRADKVGPVTSH